MGYGKKIYQEAAQELGRRRQTAEAEAQAALARFDEAEPQARVLRQAMAHNAAQAARAVLSGGDARSALEALRARAGELREAYGALLKKHGLTPESLKPRYTCPKCKDTGFQDGKMCDCFKNLQRSLAFQKLSMDVPLQSCTFEGFSLDYYADDPKAMRQMRGIVNALRDYAAHFRADSPSLLFRGGTGLGKTHLSLAIAGAAIEKGYGVIYSSVQTLAVALERERFDRRDPEDEEDTERQMCTCDLLVLDDLGAEFPSAYVSAGLSGIVNTRMLSKRPTIINTNLTMEELEKRYGERMLSRIAGSFIRMDFLGRDVRILKKKLEHEKRS